MDLISGRDLHSAHHPMMGQLIKSTILAVIFYGGTVNAAVQTTPYIAIHSKAKYSGLSHMPYANPQAPKGGILSEYSNGTFDNLNSMNGKGSSTDGINFIFDSLMSPSLDEPAVMHLPDIAGRILRVERRVFVEIEHAVKFSGAFVILRREIVARR